MYRGLAAMELIGNLKTYDWGKLGSVSKVAHLARLNNPDFLLVKDQPYAELWMGDHVSGEATIKTTGEFLGSFLKKNPSMIGGQSTLPFLFKVLSVSKALSIQVHPDKEEATQLHAKHPDIYKDANHKPELMIALTPFIAMCGFRPHKEIQDLLLSAPEMVKLLGADTIKAIDLKSPTGIKPCFTKFMTIKSDEKVSTCIKKMGERFAQEKRDDLFARVFRLLNEDYPNDIGILCLYFLNLVKLEPGESLFLAANQIHAYIDGDCVECMATSDNVVRAGLTPKFKDVETLLRIVDYGGNMNTFTPRAHPKFAHTQLFVPPVKDFAVVEIIAAPETNATVVLENHAYGSILIVLSGSGTLDVHGNNLELSMGSIIFLPAAAPQDNKNAIEQFTLRLKLNDQFIAYQAMYNDF